MAIKSKLKFVLDNNIALPYGSNREIGNTFVLRTRMQYCFNHLHIGCTPSYRYEGEMLLRKECQEKINQLQEQLSFAEQVSGQQLQDSQVGEWFESFNRIVRLCLGVHRILYYLVVSTRMPVT